MFYVSKVELSQPASCLLVFPSRLSTTLYSGQCGNFGVFLPRIVQNAQVVNVTSDDNGPAFDIFDEYTRICLKSSETFRQEPFSQSLLTQSGCLFRPIQRVEQPKQTKPFSAQTSETSLDPDANAVQLSLAERI